MPLDIVVGTQWGDEGKGHITDLLASNSDVVARFCGGDNAGHTVTIGNDIFQLHLIPSGVAQKENLCILGNGVVINPSVLIREMQELKERGISLSPQRLNISEKAHLITPAHIAIDEVNELARGSDSIGTTHRGIGPAYTDKAKRSGIRAGMLRDPEALADAVLEDIRQKNKQLTTIHRAEPVDAEAVAAEYAGYGKMLAPFVSDTSRVLEEKLKQGKSVLAEGAQGTLLDLDHGTYPFVTSSWPTSGGALIGLGVGPKHVDRVIGVGKAFTSRVGSGPFPSELAGDEAVRLRGTGEMPWDEFGTTTGRPRRVGWLDTVILRYANRINGLTELAITKLDILSGLTELPVCVAYDLDGEELRHFPNDLTVLARCRPIFKRLPGWMAEITNVRRMTDLPKEARLYLDFISQEVGVPVSLVSVGPGREQIIRAR